VSRVWSSTSALALHKSAPSAVESTTAIAIRNAVYLSWKWVSSR
jgi:hypothetical protein